MKLLNKSIQLSVSLAALFFAQSSFAAGANGTEAGTVVSNTATLSYSVGGAEQSKITSLDENGNAATTFTVDQKVDLTVDGISNLTGIVDTAPSSARSGNKLTYKLSNEGNFNQSFKIAVSHLTGTADEFDAGTTTTVLPLAAEPCQFEILVGTTTLSGGPYDLTDTPTVTLGTGVTALTGTAPTTSSGTVDKEATIEVFCSMPNRPEIEDGHTSVIDVLATAVDGAGAIMVESGADVEDAIDVVLADDIRVDSTTDTGKRNAMHADTQTFKIKAPMLSVVKTSKVISDPFNNATNPKRIPGASVEYSITITNTSESEALDVTITDVIQAAGIAVEFVPGSIVNTAGSAAAVGTTATSTVTATGITVPTAANGGSAVVTFQVKIL